MYFIWDKRKNKTNLKKHGVDFEVAKLVFDDPHLISTLDERFSYREERWYNLGSAAGIVILFVAHTLEKNENEEEIIRIISARKANKSERQRYLQRYS